MNLMFWKTETTTEDTHGGTADLHPSHAKRRLIIGAASGVLILAAIGLTAWKIFLPSPKQTTATAGTPTLIQSIPHPENQLIKSPATEFLKLRKAQSQDHQTDIEALKKKNRELQEQIEALKIEPSQVDNPPSLSPQAEIEILKKNNDALQAQIEVLKKNQQQHPAALPATQAAGKAQPPSFSGDVAIGNKNPKAAAMTLKEAIDAMNASSGNPPAKAAK